MVWILGQVQAVPMLGMTDSKDEINHFGPSFLPFLHCLGRIGVGTQIGGRSPRRGLLTKHTGTIGESISNGSTKLPEDGSKRFLEILVDFNVLVVSKVLMG